MRISLALLFGLVMSCFGLSACDDSVTDSSCSLPEVVTAVHCAAQGLGGLAGEPGFDDLIRSYVNPIRFLDDGTGYLFVYETTGLCIALPPDPSFVGENKLDLQDIYGKYVVRDLIAAAEGGGGLVEYYWMDYVTGETRRKLGYAEMIPGTNYMIGSGVYLD